MVGMAKGPEAVSLRHSVLTLGVFLILANLAAWIWALLAFHDYPVLLGTALLAYSFGLRHAVDADHIAAIDNVTRKLMQQGQKPVAVGFYFSLGHSTVVFALSVAIAATAAALETRFAGLKEAGSLIGTSVSAFFLFVIAAANIGLLIGIYRRFQQVRRGHPLVEAEMDLLTNQGGLLSRLFRRLFGLINAGWHMYPLGFLFGLGFDTATEVGLLGISATEAAQGLSIWSILVFPALFAAGMALVDTLDSILMVGAYQWAFVKPVRKLYYNLTITGMSVLVAILVGSVEVLGLMADQLTLEGPFWDAINGLNANFGLLGFLIVGLFLASWLLSVLVYRLKGYDRLEPEFLI
ncbi:MAG TPA: HoxN/HupN/NixA family nickel/cobalt transporter [Rhodospirillaceae bacterium]|nr:HoxN/HupN/NixA family nickel/cobalt transporter [Rhodospirillaceae bacterium]